MNDRIVEAVERERERERERELYFNIKEYDKICNKKDSIILSSSYNNNTG